MDSDRPSKSGGLQGLVFCIPGPLSRLSKSECKEYILSHGGQVTHVLSSVEMESVYENEYKCQFLPEFRACIDEAMKRKVKIVSEDFLDKCVAVGKKVKEGPYLLFQRKQAVDEAFESVLDRRVQDLVNLLFDEDEMERSLSDMGLDSKQILQVVNATVLKQAYAVLAELDTMVRSPQPSSPELQRQHMARIKEKSDQFYSLVPHVRRSTLSTADAVKEKLSVMEAIRDVEIASKLMKEGRAGGSLSPVDVRYRKLKTKFEPLERHTQEYAYIDQYIKNSHGQAHSDFQLEVESVFRMEREGEAERFEPFRRLPHHRLLWHGSRFCNWIGIITQGLRIAPPEAPVTGYFLGKGLYFADMISNCAGYCHASKDNPQAIMLLCEVSLGRWFQLAHGKFICKEDLDNAGFHSTKCCGEMAPDPSFDFTTSDGYIIPLGREVETGVLCSTLVHNEFVVYDPAQVLIRYLLRVNFVFSEKRPEISY